jgi:carboxyl-terminal processing protease
VVIERRNNESSQTFSSTDAGLAQDIPMVVLVNGGSASASEIVAGALQDRGRAKLIGEKTFGKGSVQQVQDFDDGSELRVTIAHWFTPNDRGIHGTGLEPDVAVKMTQDDVKAGRDPQLDRAVEYLLKGQ